MTNAFIAERGRGGGSQENRGKWKLRGSETRKGNGAHEACSHSALGIPYGDLGRW